MGIEVDSIIPFHQHFTQFILTPLICRSDSCPLDPPSFTFTSPLNSFLLPQRTMAPPTNSNGDDADMQFLVNMLAYCGELNLDSKGLAKAAGISQSYNVQVRKVSAGLDSI